MRPAAANYCVKTVYNGNKFLISRKLFENDQCTQKKNTTTVRIIIKYTLLSFSLYLVIVTAVRRDWWIALIFFFQIINYLQWRKLKCIIYELMTYIMIKWTKIQLEYNIVITSAKPLNFYFSPPPCHNSYTSINSGYIYKF